MILLGSSVASASALVDYPVAGGQALRYGLGAALLFALARGRLPRITGGQGIRVFALAGTGLAGFNAFLIAAVREADAASVGMIVACVPVALALFGPLLESRPLSPRVLVAAVLVAAGAATVQWSGGGMSLLALLLALGALACEAAFSLVAVPLLASLGPVAVSTYACVFATPVLLISALAVNGTGALPVPTVEEAAALAYLAVMVTAAGFALWYSSIERLGVDRAGLFAGVMPVSALLTAAAIGASAVTVLRLLGALAVGAGVMAGVTTFRQVPGPRPYKDPPVPSRASRLSGSIAGEQGTGIR